MNKIIEKYYYIIKVDCDNNTQTYYKIGEANNIKRPEKLIEKYRKLRSNNAELLHFEVLPHNETHRLNDKMIHSAIDSTKMISADPIYIEHYLDEVDGKNEFFKVIDPTINVVDYIKELVISLSQKKYYTAKNTFDTTLNYDEDKYHLVDTDILNKIINKYSLVNKSFYKFINSNILLIGQFDFDFIATIAGIHNIYLWHDSAEQKHEYTYSFINERIHYINSLEELLNMSDIKFDVVISNPPYGKIGAEITRNIIDNIEFDQFVNLLPANDYHRGTDDLYKYVDIKSMDSIRNGFTDAAVTTHLTLINKEQNNLTEDEFEIENYIDESLKKYFYENYKRDHYAIDKMPVCGLTVNNARIWDVSKTFIIGYRDMNHKHLPYTKDCTTYKWNVEESIDMQYIIDNKPKSTQQLIISQCEFNSSIEKTNFVKFIYSTNGFKFMSKVFTALNCDARVEHNAFPKMDWTKEWTVEEILKEYGYTDNKIKKIMDDLDNFKYLED